MTIHYHGTPITPTVYMSELRGRFFCVSFAQPQQVKIAHEIGQGVMLDNGAFSVWKRGVVADWPGYYEFCSLWLERPTTWAVIPDVIVGDEAQQDALVASWPFGVRGAPVWHMHEDLDRLRRLTDEWPVVCVGSSAQYARLLTDSWCSRIDAAWDAVMRGRVFTPWLHMLRGMQIVGERWPFASVDSTDVARNHRRAHNSPGAMAERWDGQQCPASWAGSAKQIPGAFDIRTRADSRE